MTEWDDIDEYYERGEDMGMMGEGHIEWLINLMREQTKALEDCKTTLDVLNDMLSPENLKMMDDIIGAMLIYVDDYPALHENIELTQEQRDYIFQDEVIAKAEEIVGALSDEKLRGILIGMALLLKNESEGKNNVLVACDIYHVIKTILYERTGCIT